MRSLRFIYWRRARWSRPDTRCWRGRAGWSDASSATMHPEVLRQGSLFCCYIFVRRRRRRRRRCASPATSVACMRFVKIRVVISLRMSPLRFHMPENIGFLCQIWLRETGKAHKSQTYIYNSFKSVVRPCINTT